jgi:hypothetical protein
MIRAKTETPADVIRWMQSEAGVVAGDARLTELSTQSVHTP